MDEQALTATLVMSDGTFGPALRLRGLLEAFSDAVSASDDD